VRGSIQAVPRGQVEAATALALSSGQRMRLVVLPQAMRIAVPAFGNQYLNLVKNSSLAVAISYFELTKITQTTIANRAPAVPSYGLLLFIYLALSLALSAVVNLVNRRLALVER
jgi:general L-amino acid transport system permease protein